MSAFPFRVGPSDLLFYGHGTASLRLYATHSESLMLTSQIVMRCANNDYVMERDTSVTPVKIEPSAIVLNANEKRSIAVTFSAGHVPLFAVGKLLIRAIKLHSEEVIGTYQIPIFGLARCTAFQCESFTLSDGRRTGMTVLNTGNAHGLMYLGKTEPEIRVISPGERLFVDNLGDVKNMILAPLLVSSIMQIFTDEALVAANIQPIVIASLRKTIPLIHTAENESALQKTGRLAAAISSAYSSYPFRSNLLQFMFEQCVFYTRINSALERGSVFVAQAPPQGSLASTRSSSSISGTDPQVVSSSNVSVSLPSIMNSSRPIGGLSDRMLSSSDSVHMHTNLASSIPAGQPQATDSSTSTPYADAKQPDQKDCYNPLSEATEKLRVSDHQTTPLATVAYDSGLVRLTAPASASYDPQLHASLPVNRVHTDMVDRWADCPYPLPTTNVPVQPMNEPMLSNRQEYAMDAVETAVQNYIPSNMLDDSIHRLSSAAYYDSSQRHLSMSPEQTIQRLPSCDPYDPSATSESSLRAQKSVTFSESNTGPCYPQGNASHTETSASALGTPSLSQSYSINRQLTPKQVASTSGSRISAVSPGIRSMEADISHLPEHSLEYKNPDDAMSERERELIDRYNSTLSEYRSLSQGIKDNSRSASTLSANLRDGHNSTPYALEQEICDEYLPDIRPMPIRFAEDSVIYNNPVTKKFVNGIPIYTRNSCNATMFWRVLNDSFLLCGSPSFPPYLESFRGKDTIGGICYLTGTITIENNANQSGFFDALMQAESLTNPQVLDAAEELHYLYYSLSFATCDPSVLKMRLGVKADRPLFGCLAPGEQHTIAVTIAIAYSDVNDTGLPELPMFLQAFRRDVDGMAMRDAGSPLFMRVFGARFDRKFYNDNLETLAVLQEKIRTPSQFSVQECVDLPIRFLPGMLWDRNVGVIPSGSRDRLLEMNNSKQGVAASSNCTCAGISYKSDRNNVQCFNLAFLRALSSFPVLQITTGQSLTLPEVTLSIPEVDFPTHKSLVQHKDMVASNLNRGRNVRASRPGADVLFISSANPTSAQQRQYGCPESTGATSYVLSTSHVVPVTMPAQALPKSMCTGTKFSISITPASTPVIKEYLRESVASREGNKPFFVPLPIMTSVFACNITASCQPDELASVENQYRTEVLISPDELAQYSNTSNAIKDSTEYPVAYLTVYANFTPRLTRRLIRALASCEHMPCFLEQTYEVHLRRFMKHEISAVSYMIMIRVPLQVDRSSLAVLRDSAAPASVDRLMRNHDQSSKTASLLVSNAAMNMKIGNVNGFLSELWTDSYSATLPPAFIGGKSFSSITLHNAADYPIVAILSGLSLPFDYRKTCRLEPLSSLLVPINFAPKRVGTYSGTLTISYIRVIPNDKQEELLLQKSLLDQGRGVCHAFSKEHYLEADEAQDVTASAYRNRGRPKSAQMWDNMMVKPGGRAARSRAISSKIISKDGLEHMERCIHRSTGPIVEMQRSQVIAPETPKFYVKLVGVATNTPLVVTKPSSQAHDRGAAPVCDGNWQPVIHLQRGARGARMLLTNVSDRTLHYDTQLLFPGNLESHDAAYQMLTVMPPSGYIEPKCQAAVSLYGEQQFGPSDTIILNIYTRYKSGGDTMKALSYRGLVKLM